MRDWLSFQPSLDVLPDLVWRRVDSLHALSTSRLLPDVWAINSGTLHLNVGKTTYEVLGVQGGKVHEVFKGKGVEEQYRAFFSNMIPASPFPYGHISLLRYISGSKWIDLSSPKISQSL